MALHTGFKQQAGLAQKAGRQQSPTIGCARCWRRNSGIDSHEKLCPSATEVGHAVTSLMAQMDHGAVQRFLALVDTSGVVRKGSESETESEAVWIREAPSSSQRSKRRKGDLTPSELTRADRQKTIAHPTP